MALQTQSCEHFEKAHENMVDHVIADCDGDPRAAVSALLKINYALQTELREITGKRAFERVPAG